MAHRRWQTSGKKKSRPMGRLSSVGQARGLLDVLADQASHLEHRDLGLAEHFLELGISVDPVSYTHLTLPTTPYV